MVTDGIFPLVLGGMQSHAANLARHLARCGAQVDVIHPSPDPGGLARSFFDAEGSNVQLVQVPWPAEHRYPGHYVAELWKYSTKVREIIPSLAADCIYVQGLCGGALLASRRPRLPQVAVNLHGLEMFQHAADLWTAAEQTMLRPLARYSARRADLCVSLGGTLTPLLVSVGVDRSRIAEIPVGIDSDWIVAAPKPSGVVRKIVFVGRNERRKGIAELATALERLAVSHSFEFDFIGPIEPVHGATLAGVRYHGEIRDRDMLRRIVAQADVLVCPSFSEGMPTVILEAMSQGLAVIASRVGAVEELVGENNGWLINPGDANTLYLAMRAAIEISDDDLMSRKRSSLSRMANRFTWPAVAEKTLVALEKTISAGQVTRKRC